MPGFGAGNVSGVVMGGFLCLGLVMTTIAAAIVLSLISIYTPNHSKEGWGEEYRCDSMMLKILYNNLTYSFSDGTIAYSTDFSSYCDKQLSNSSVRNVMGCVLTDGRGWGPYNSSSTARRRRRADVSVGLYSIYDGRIFFSNKCAKDGDKNKTQNSSSLSHCVKQRLEYVNSLVNNHITTTAFKTWVSTPSVTLSIVDSSDSPAYRSLSPTQVYGVPRTVAGTEANSLGVDSTTKTELSAGCRYVGGLSKSAIAAIIAAYESETTTSPPTVDSG